MPYIGLGLHVLAAIYFAVHAIRSGQSLYWLILLFSFPLLGSVVYFLAIYFPEARKSPDTRAAFERAVECGNDAAARCLYAEWLMAQPQPDDREQARSLFASIIDDAQHWSRHARSHNAAWLERTKAALNGR